MNCCLVLFSVLVTAVCAAPQGYHYKDPTLVVGQNNFHKFGPLKVLPCPHASERLPPVDFINTQSQGRILNHKENYETVNKFVGGGVNIPHKHSSTLENYVSNQSHNSESASVTTQLLPPVAAPPAHYFNEAGAGGVQQGPGSKYNPIGPSFNTFNLLNGNKPFTSSFIGNTLAHTSASESTQLWYPSTQITNENLEFNTGAINAQLGNVIRETVANSGLDPSIEKHVYVHVAPEDLEDNNQKFNHQQIFAPPPKKHYKIIFIKAPTQQTNNYNQLAVAPEVEEKTLVYVLVKKPEEPSLSQIQQSAHKSSKPEVYFIKYKTREEGNSVGHFSANSQNLVNAVNESNIDIRNGGDGVFNPHISAAEKLTNNQPKHELYGVPLQ